MSNSATQSERPTLPSLQDLFPDEQFERLRLESSESVATAHAMPPLSTVQIPGFNFRSARREPPPVSRSPRTSAVAAIPRSSDGAMLRAVRPAPYPDPRPFPPLNAATSATNRSQPCAGKRFDDHLPSRHPHAPLPSTIGSSIQARAVTADLPTYTLSADECPPDDDRRHGCGICHRRFNRPSSLMIHMNSHTGAQPFECPFPGCTRRFSVNSNMRRHYRNHREGPSASVQIHSYPPAYYPTPESSPSPYSRAAVNSPSTSSQSSFTDSDDRPEAMSGLHNDQRAFALCQGRTRSGSDAYQPTQNHPVSRPRACTVPGCNCNEAPSALRPAAFHQGSSRFSPIHR